MAGAPIMRKARATPTPAAPVPDALTLVLPTPPSANRYWRHVGTRVVLSREARAYREAVYARLLSALGRICLYHDGDVRLTYRWFRARKSGDLDNRAKQIQDSLEYCGVLRDDAQIAEIHAYRDDTDSAHARVEITLEAL